VVGYENWIPVPNLEFPGVKDLLDRYQAQAKTEGLDPLGYGMVPTAYAQVQALGEAVAATGSLDQDKIAAYMHSQPIHTVWAISPSVRWRMERGARACRPISRHYGQDDRAIHRSGKNDRARSRPFQIGELIYPYARR